MFQTEPILFLQSFASPFWNAVMVGLSTLGYQEFFIPFLVFVLFAVDLRRGFLLLQTLIWTLFATLGLKELLSLPRPFHVDRTVRLLADGSVNPSPFDGRDAPGFWSPLPSEVCVYWRTLAESQSVRWGFPSGHTSSAVAVWGGTLLLWPRRWMTWLAAVLIVAIPLSRVYLGLHFVADLTGGLVVGAAMLVPLWLLGRGRWSEAYLGEARGGVATRGGFGVTALVAGPVLLGWVIPGVPADVVAIVTGLNAAMLGVAARGTPTVVGPGWRRVPAVLAALGAFVAVSLAVKSALAASGLGDTAVEVLGGLAGGSALVAAGVVVGRLVGSLRAPEGPR